MDENFAEFADNWDIVRHRLTIFLGAGASIGAVNRTGNNVPSAYDLRNQLWSRFKHADSAPFDPASLRLMGLEHAAAIVETKTGRVPLIEHLVQEFTCDLPLWQHCALTYLNPASVFTTNYDDLIERGYAHRNIMCDVIYNNRPPVADRRVIYKPHGSLGAAHSAVGSGGMVITQFDYFRMLTDYRKMLLDALTGFGTKCVIFVGYSFGDMDICSLLFEIRKQNSGIPWYAVFPRADKHVRDMYYRNFGIKQIDSTFEKFLMDLEARFDFLPGEWKHSNKNNLRSRGFIQ